MKRENLIFREGKWPRPNWMKPSPPQNPRPNPRPYPYQQCPYNPPRHPYTNGTPMGVDTLQKAETMEDKKKHRDEDTALNAANKDIWLETVQPRNSIQGHPRNHLI